MWLVITFIFAVIITAIHFGLKNMQKYRLDFLALMLWGTFIMILADHSIAFLEEGGDFIAVTTEGLIPDSAFLGVLMIIPLVAIWAAVAFTGLGKKICID